jgi:type I restriction enzyme M protein
MGSSVSRTQIEFSDEEIAKIAETFNAWTNGNYEDVDGFCASVTRQDIAKNGDSLSPGRYIGSEVDESESDEDFGLRMERLTSDLAEQLEASSQLEDSIKRSLKALGYDL